MDEVERLAAGTPMPDAGATAWNWAQTLVHAAQSIEYSLLGFPVQRPVWFQRSLGAAAIGFFGWRGRMHHGLSDPIPGAPALDGSVADAAVALSRLRAAVQQFSETTAPLHPHFAYGTLDRARHEQAHAMHLAHHLSVFYLA